MVKDRSRLCKHVFKSGQLSVSQSSFQMTVKSNHVIALILLELVF